MQDDHILKVYVDSNFFFFVWKGSIAPKVVFVTYFSCFWEISMKNVSGTKGDLLIDSFVIKWVLERYFEDMKRELDG